MLDRLLDHAIAVTTDGESFRIREPRPAPPGGSRPRPTAREMGLALTTGGNFSLAVDSSAERPGGSTRSALLGIRLAVLDRGLPAVQRGG
jgi:hypothetical protein